MTRYVAFLRGINVGGHNIVKKEKLLEAFVSLGFKNVSTFKQSGNVVFEADSADAEALRSAIQQRLRTVLSYEVVVILRTIAQLEEFIKNNPFEHANTEGASLLVTFMSDRPTGYTMPIEIPKSTAEIIQIRGFEAYSITRGHGDGGKPNPFIEKQFKTEATSRNWNIIKEIAKTYSENNTQK
jgi:uncharacterized protein (DUF1697 family)